MITDCQVRLEDGNIIQLDEMTLRNIISKVLKEMPLYTKEQQNKLPRYLVWLSYDLGFGEYTKDLSKEEQGEKYEERYKALMAWLKSKRAEECGYSVGRFWYETDDEDQIENLLGEEILNAFAKAEVRDLRGIRMYVVISNEEKSIISNAFIVGRRNKHNPWDEE